MKSPEELSLSVDDFSGVARIFPLPNVVMFPHVLQPLHIFEPRYREMLEDALADDRMIAMALLKPGWQSQCESQPPIEPVVCLGRVVTHTRLPDGRYNLMLLGLRRARICTELPPIRSFRQAQVELLEDALFVSMSAKQTALQTQLLDAIRELLPDDALVHDDLQEMFGRKLSLAALTDMVAFAMDLDLALKQALLSERNVERRARCLLECLAARTCPGPQPAAGLVRFPPDFSLN